jgi:hypothetical protein
VLNLGESKKKFNKTGENSIADICIVFIYSNLLNCFWQTKQKFPQFGEFSLKMNVLALPEEKILTYFLVK